MPKGEKTHLRQARIRRRQKIRPPLVLSVFKVGLKWFSLETPTKGSTFPNKVTPPPQNALGQFSTGFRPVPNKEKRKTNNAQTLKSQGPAGCEAVLGGSWKALGQVPGAVSEVERSGAWEEPQMGGSSLGGASCLVLLLLYFCEWVPPVSFFRVPPTFFGGFKRKGNPLTSPVWGVKPRNKTSLYGV